ncbi:PTS sugar transporter [Virgibacillus profundi]|uniref:PTS sugar transporter n=1 Tax=Virgibacillus profundi TaxID=2024555 RepID=A0A2A2IB55_9BACI|nr:PTS sugar transporter subunit IIB [Virgibacillus profundi]PAV28375.1 PTS sugar transporter [Virgibacillus profundi]PXY52263.1 PTS mannose/fructose/sorbose transporter subunit IIB [Virgibacillus profundi]
MAEIELVRIDSRLIHGQVVTKWIKQTSANRIVIIDDSLFADDFMKEVYTMAAPPGIEVNVYSVDFAVDYWKKEKMGKGKLFILFKNVETVYRTIKEGVPINDVQIGGLGGGPGRISVFGPISFDEEDSKMLKELEQEKCHVYLHQVPDESKMELKKALERYHSLKTKG